MSYQQPQSTNPILRPDSPWYKQFWPWFIIALPLSAVIASFISLWLAVSHPDHPVLTEDEYRRLKSELTAQVPVQKENAAGKPGSRPEQGDD